ncbi:hypothetical protein DSM106972_016650 [Dulcicalothrix desertica PCC 7102]|uniref:Uncharacterized protein n=1 Tax=Dulcicalothrix desertica PCC 7102 TaxID=232991 RepID=A0A3S1BB69_9CYAN|nr:hypothetical protein [Dulcicalothrix desertica]RUT08497.1 hypothetical protein DSM106972_016650 [Dulcicalothrix desertica PCC 7102]
MVEKLSVLLRQDERNRLDLNDERNNEGSIIKARRLWIKGGWHPPLEDPRRES